MSTLPESILRHARSLPEGGVLSPKEFLHLGSRVAVDQAFSQLVKAGKLLRVVRTYVAPVLGRFGTRPPAPEKVIKSIAEQSGEFVAPHGASAANALGLTQQVPIREVYLTSSRTRKLKLGRSEVLIKHVPRWMLALGTGPAGDAVRALAWMGPAHAGESLTALRRTLSGPEWRTLILLAQLCHPGWPRRSAEKRRVADYFFGDQGVDDISRLRFSFDYVFIFHATIGCPQYDTALASASLYRTFALALN